MRRCLTLSLNAFTSNIQKCCDFGASLAESALAASDVCICPKKSGAAIATSASASDGCFGVFDFLDIVDVGMTRIVYIISSSLSPFV